VIDRDIHLARALLVDGNAMMRNVTAAQLRDAGVGQVQTAGRVKEARLMLEREHFDIVLCTTSSTDARHRAGPAGRVAARNLLPHSTVFLMVAEKATYHQVVEAAESALDGLLVRPFTAALLCQRLLEARNRKRQLGDVLRALDAGQTEVAFARALKRFNDNLPYGSYCGRLAAELLLTMQRPDDARQGIRKTRPDHRRRLGRLGVARTQMAAGDHSRRPADHPDGAGRSARFGRRARPDRPHPGRTVRL
jgi:AmiR/NasT family two-component response regulator